MFFVAYRSTDFYDRLLVRVYLAVRQICIENKGENDN